MKNSGKPVTEAEVLNLENNVIGCDLPDPYRNFLLANNGGVPALTEISFEDIEGSENETSIRLFYGIHGKKNLDEDLETTIKFWWVSERIIDTVVPIAEDIAGNIIGISVHEDTYGEIYFFDCDVEGDYEPEENLADLAPDFTQFLAMLKQEE